MPTVARGGVLNLIGAAVTAVTGILLTIAVTRALPQSRAGVFFSLTSIFLLAETLARLGTGTGLVYFIARLRAVGDVVRIRAFQRVALIPVVILSVLTAVLLVVAAPGLARIGGESSGTARLGILVLAAVLPVAALSDTWLSATRGHATMLPTVAVDKIGRPLVQLVLVAAFVGADSLPLLAGAWALPWAASALLAWWWLRRLSPGRPDAGGDARPTAGTWREFWGFTAPRAVNSIAQLAQQRLDIVLVAVLIGPASAAVYTAATRFLVVGQQGMLAVATAAQPRLAEVLAVDDRASARTIYQSATAWIVLLTWPLYLLSTVFASEILSVFGNGYRAGQSVVLVLAGAMLVSTACGMVDMVLNMAGRTSWTLINSVVSLSVMVGVDLLLIPRLGILGAGIGWAAAIVANNLLPLTQLLVAFGLHPFGRATLAAAGLSSVCFAAFPVLAGLLFPGSLAARGVAVLAGTALFLVVCTRWRGALSLPSLRALRRRPTYVHPGPQPGPRISGGTA